jgi:hypothetical protein
MLSYTDTACMAIALALFLNMWRNTEILWKEPVFGNVSHGQDNIKMDLEK